MFNAEVSTRNTLEAGDDLTSMDVSETARHDLFRLLSFPVLVVTYIYIFASGEIDKADLEKLVKDKEATELKAAEKQRVSAALCPRFEKSADAVGARLGWSLLGLSVRCPSFCALCGSPVWFPSPAPPLVFRSVCTRVDPTSPSVLRMKYLCITA